MFKAGIFKIGKFSCKLSRWSLQGHPIGLEKDDLLLKPSFLLLPNVQMTPVFLTHNIRSHSASHFSDILLVYYQMDKKKKKKTSYANCDPLGLNSICLSSVQSLRKTPGVLVQLKYTNAFKQVYAITIVFHCPFVHIIAVGSFMSFVSTSLTIFQLIHILAFSIVLLFSVTLLFENRVSLLWQSLIICASLTPHSRFSGESEPGSLVPSIRRKQSCTGKKTPSLHFHFC